MSRGVYRGIHSSLLDDPDFQRLTPRARHVLLTVRLCVEAGPACIFRYYPEVLCRRTGYSRRHLNDALTELEQAQWIVLDADVLWIRNGLRHDPHIRLSNPHHVDAAVRQIEALPSSSARLIAKFCQYYKIGKAIDTLPHSPEGVPPQEEEKEEEILQEKEKEKDCAAHAALTPTQLIDLFNKLTPTQTPAVLTRSPERLRKARASLQRFPSEEFWRETFAMFHRSEFLRGLTKPTNGHTSFVADFDWLLSRGKDGTENVVKVHDGRYA
jgi:hypothetical protein